MDLPTQKMTLPEARAIVQQTQDAKVLLAVKERVEVECPHTEERDWFMRWLRPILKHAQKNRFGKALPTRENEAERLMSEYGYSKRAAEWGAEALGHRSPVLWESFEAWWYGEEEVDFARGGYSLSQLTSEYGYTYPVAIFLMSYVLRQKEPAEIQPIYLAGDPFEEAVSGA